MGINTKIEKMKGGIFMEREVKVGQVYRHFKGTTHKIICIAKQSETKEDLVIYTH